MTDLRRGFTLVELLIVIAIVAILAVVVTVVLNPAQLLAQARDATRVSDMATLSAAISLYKSDQQGATSYTLGSSTVAYLSVPAADSACASLGIASSAAWPSRCSTSANYRSPSSAGWLPINFQNIAGGSPLGTLPVDPVNQTSSDLYYTYQTDGARYSLSAFFESQKYAKNAASTGGTDPVLYSVGTGITTLPEAGRGLVGYWPLNEGANGLAYDWSVSHATGTWGGTAAGTSGYYSAGKIGQWGGFFDGSTTYLNAPAPPQVTGPITLMAWVYPLSWPGDIMGYAGYNPTWGYTLLVGSTKLQLNFEDSGGTWRDVASSVAVPTNTWSQVAMTYDQHMIDFYLNGVLQQSIPWTYSAANTAAAFDFGRVGWTHFHGTIDDGRLYNRVLSANEILQIYNAEK